MSATMRLGSLRPLPCAPSTSGRPLEAAPLAARQPLCAAQTRRPQGRGALLVAATAATPGGGMTLQQRWRAFKFGLQDRKKELAQSPPVAALAAALAALRAQLEPVVALATEIRRRRDSVVDMYNQFLAEETKRKWTWSKRNVKELALLQAVPDYVFFFACTLVYLAFTPLTFILSLVLPLYYSWIMYDHWWASPVLAGLLVMAPLKFVPWGFGVACWVWPGLI